MSRGLQHRILKSFCDGLATRANSWQKTGEFTKNEKKHHGIDVSVNQKDLDEKHG